MNLASNSSETYSPDNLIAGGSTVTNNGTLLTGNNLTRGTVLGRVKATGKLTTCVQTAVDGSGVPVGILVHDIDASAADKSCQYYMGGEYRDSEMTWDASWTAVLKPSAFDGTAIKIV